MDRPYSELVIEGPFQLVKGFLFGYRCGVDDGFRCFFHRKAGIRRETLHDLMVDFLDLENLVHVCVEDRAVVDLKQAIARAESSIGIRVRSVRNVRSASFGYSVRVYNEQLARDCAFLTGPLPDGLDRTESAHFSLEEGGPKLSVTSAAHRFDVGSRGNIRGPLGRIIDLYLQCKRSPAAEFITTTEIFLDFVPDPRQVPSPA